IPAPKERVTLPKPRAVAPAALVRPLPTAPKALPVRWCELVALGVTCNLVSVAEPLRARAGRDRFALLVPARGRRDEREAFLTDMLVTLAATNPLVTLAAREEGDCNQVLSPRQ